MNIYNIDDFGGSAVNPPLLAVRDLCKYFPIRSRGLVRRKVGDVKAVDHVSFDLYRNETLGLVGESGCGKSTTVRTILRALDFTGGHAYFDPEGSGRYVDFGELTAHELVPLRRAAQMIFQDPFSSLNPRMTIGGIVAEPLVIHGLARGKALEERVDEILVKVGLKPEYKTRYPHAFSGGQRQRIGIARALVMNPKFVVADEAGMPDGHLGASVSCKGYDYVVYDTEAYSYAHILRLMYRGGRGHKARLGTYSMETGKLITMNGVFFM